MTNELQEIKELFEQIDQRIKALEEKCKEDEEWPKDGDLYSVISTRGKAFEHIWQEDFFDHDVFDVGNIFKTKEEAEFEVERLKVLRELEKMGSPFKTGDLNWSVMLDDSEDIFFSCSDCDRRVYGNYYFDTEEKLKEAVEKIGEDRIKKYLFGVE